MTKLYCPKGHEVNKAAPAWQKNGHYVGDFTFCPTCDRFYSTLDCGKETKKDQPDFCFSEKKVKMVCLQDIVPPLKVASTLFEKPVSNSPTPKTESQVAIDRVVEALRSVCKSANINGLSNLNVLDVLIHKLEELNK